MSDLTKKPTKAEEPAGAAAEGMERGGAGIPLRWWMVALILGAAMVYWVFRSEIVHASIQVGSAVPPIPALCGLLIMLAAAALVRQRGRLAVPRRRILWVYILLTIAASVSGTASMSFIFAHISVPQYLGATQPGMARIANYFPRWFAPPSGEVMRQFYEGYSSGPIPWDVWIMPLLAWGVLLVTLMLTLYALLALLRQSWMESERLSYPLVQIPLRISEGGPTSIWRSPILWIGFALSAGLDSLNMLHAFYPAVPAVDIFIQIGDWFPSIPWNALSPLWINYRPEIIGIAYLIPSDVLLTTGVSFLLLRLSAVARAALGENIASTGYDYQELGIGAFICLFGMLIWRAKPQLKASLFQALGLRPRPAGQNEPLSPRAAWGTLLVGLAVMIVWLRLAGLPLWLAAAHLFLLIAVAVVYARIRAETGATSIYLFPFWQQQQMLTNFFGPRLLFGASDRTLSVFAALGGLSRGYYPESCSFGAEGMSLAARAGIPQKRVTTAIIVGLILGLALGGYLYVVAGYHQGMNQLDGGTGQSGYRVSLATQQYNGVISAFDSPGQPRPGLIFQTFLGGSIALFLSLMRQRFFWFPFHPTGFAIASAYGIHLWLPFLVVWVFKSIVWRFGGSKGYSRLIPFFLGIVFGRYLFTGIIWGLFGFFGHPATKTYQIHFS
ncbi:MAG: hypothetical protein IT210_12795 [Armatimonadetes bacterium]|nr:hypothetical protein [Armatimonadota bacterium]